MTLRVLMLLWIAVSALGLAASAWMVVRAWVDAAAAELPCPNRASG